MPPAINPKKDSFEVILYKEKINEGVNKLHKFIKLHPGNRTPFFAKELNTSVKNIERWVKELKVNDKIKFKGNPKKGGYYTK